LEAVTIELLRALSGRYGCVEDSFFQRTNGYFSIFQESRSQMEEDVFPLFILVLQKWSKKDENQDFHKTVQYLYV